MNEQHEYQLRRRAIRLTLQGHARQAILARIPRSPAWLSKRLSVFPLASLLHDNQGEGAPRTIGTLDRDLPAEQFGQLLTEVQAQPSPLLSPGG